MARKPKKEHFEKIYQGVENNPGKRPGFIAQILNMPRSQVTRSLPTMQEEGYLLSEDEKGGLWVFKKWK